MYFGYSLGTIIIINKDKQSKSIVSLLLKGVFTEEEL